MAKFYEIDGIQPVVGASTFVHPDAVIIGDVVIGENCYIGPLCSLRGDFGRIEVGDGANIQDQCVLHTFPDQKCIVGPGAHISHGAVLHGCTVENGGFVGISSVVMDGATIGTEAMVGAMAFIKAAFNVPPRSLATGMPAKVVRELSEIEIAWLKNGPRQYQHLAQRSLKTLSSSKALSSTSEARLAQTLNVIHSKPLHKTRE